MITILMFLALDGHLMVLELLATTFKTLPIGHLRFDPNAWNLIARYGSTIFLTGLLLALPMVATLLIISLAMGILNRVSPQLTVFSVGFPLTLSVGLILLMVVMGDLGPFLASLLTNTPALHAVPGRQHDPCLTHAPWSNCGRGLASDGGVSANASGDWAAAIGGKPPPTFLDVIEQ
jgi:hypothetical protein